MGGAVPSELEEREKLRLVVLKVAWCQKFHSRFSSILLRANLCPERLDEESLLNMMVAKNAAWPASFTGEPRRVLPCNTTSMVKKQAATGASQWDKTDGRQPGQAPGEARLKIRLAILADGGRGVQDRNCFSQ